MFLALRAPWETAALVFLPSISDVRVLRGASSAQKTPLFREGPFRILKTDSKSI